MTYPTKVGQPCWDESQLDHVITITAQTNEQSADVFLAAHSPFRFITSARGAAGHEHGEEDVFREIFDRRGEVQAAIKGEPGTGKSHLVHWLKLRTDAEAENPSSPCARLVRVLVQRRNGSFKDALHQILDRLGGRYGRHLERLQGAIETISKETAGATLILKLSLEIGEYWGRERENLASLPYELRRLPEALKSHGVVNWLRRSGGVVEQVIRRLAQGPPPADREGFPEFTAEELTPSPSYLGRRENSEEVQELFEDFEAEPELRQRAVDVLNRALRDAMSSLMGISGNTLREIFDEVRRDLYKEKKELALFIEDVSVTGLDREIINALEPQKRDGLCRMVAVIGITSNAWIPLEDNQKARFDPVFEVGAGVAKRWADSPTEVADFTARYLNAIRSTDEEIVALARERRTRGDVSWSKCGGCPVRTGCHEVFGRVELPGGVAIGTFPFTWRAPQALLSGLDDRVFQTGVGRSQRGLIENVLLPVLQRASRQALVHGEFPRPAALPVQTKLSASWTGFSFQFLGSWEASNKDRLQLLASYWVEDAVPEGLATQLTPLLKPLGLPPFTRAAAPAKSPAKPASGAISPAPDAAREPAKIPPALQSKLVALTRWAKGEARLTGDGEFREWLKNFFTNSVAWPDESAVPISSANTFVRNSAFPKIEEQAGNPATIYRNYLLPRDSETRDLLEALAQFYALGKGTWNFESSEVHKRNMCRWLRRHRSEVVGALQPDAPIQPQEAVKTAARALAVAAVLRDRKRLPEDPDERLARVFAPVWTADKRPIALDKTLRQLIEHLEQNHQRLCDFLVSELGAGQGWSEPGKFLDPRLVLRALREDAFSDWPTLAAEYSAGFSQRRFQALRGLNSFAALASVLAAEQARTAEIIVTLRDILAECGVAFDGDGRVAVEAWLEELQTMVEMQRGTTTRRYQFQLPDPAFDELWRARRFQTQGERAKLAAVLHHGVHAARSDVPPIETLTYDPGPLQDLQKTLGTTRAFLRELDTQLTAREHHLAGAGGGNRDELLGELDAFAQLGQTPAGSPADSDDE